MLSSYNLTSALATNDTANEVMYGGGLHYVPTRGVTYTFIILFSITTLAHFGQSIYYHKMFMLPTAVFGGLLEIAGWGGRLWQNNNKYSNSPFQLHVTATVLGPTPLVAANFVVSGRIIQILGVQYSRIRPKLYAIIFCTCDVVSLMIQGTGGGIAGGAGDNIDQAQLGSRVALAGTLFQFAVILLYAAFKIEFLIRHARDSPIHPTTSPRRSMDKRMKILVCALAFSTLCLVIRSIYRIVEFADGWDGRIINTEVYFNTLDGMMVILAMYTLNFVHPGFMLPSKNQLKKSEDTERHMEMRGMVSSTH